MTDYYPLLARAVAGLEKNTGEARRVLYERARTALVAQLRGADPPLSEQEVTRERLALEEAVRRVEADAARQMRAPPAERAAPPPKPGETAQHASKRPDAPSPPQSADRDRASEEPRRSASPQRQAPERAASAGTEGVPGLRDVVAEADTLGEATAQASRSAREAYASVPANVPDLDRIEPRVEPEGLRGPPRGRGRPAPDGRPPEMEPGDSSSLTSEEPARRRPVGPMPRRPFELDDRAEANPARRGLIAAVITVLLIAGLGATAYWQRQTISGWFNAAREAAPSRPRDQAQMQPKSTDRVGQDGQPPAPSEQQPAPGTPAAVVAQRVVLYEEDPTNPQGNRHVGSALWRTETVSPGPGQSPELAIRADIEIPERRLAMTMSIRRNTDKALPASHTVEIMFNLPADFAMGGVANVPGLLMKEAEQTRGAPLSGLAVKVTNGFFLIGLSGVEADLQRNLQLLRERGWFDIPMVYNNGRRAIMAVEKGNPGERAFKEAFAAWGK